MINNRTKKRKMVINKIIMIKMMKMMMKMMMIKATAKYPNKMSKIKSFNKLSIRKQS